MGIYYTYLIGWSKHDKWYYGVRYAKNSNPDELWKTYFTSSKYVKDFRENNGEPDIIQVRKQFINAKDARIFEHGILKKLQVVSDERWLNKTDNISIDPICAAKGSSKKNSKEHCENIRKALTGRKLSDETKRKISESMKGKTGFWKGKKLSEYTKQKLSIHGKTLVGDKNPFFGRTHTEETKKKISDTKKHQNINT